MLNLMLNILHIITFVIRIQVTFDLCVMNDGQLDLRTFEKLVIPVGYVEEEISALCQLQYMPGPS
jgi:hypothetical protein